MVSYVATVAFLLSTYRTNMKLTAPDLPYSGLALFHESTFLMPDLGLLWDLSRESSKTWSRVAISLNTNREMLG